MTTDQKLIDVGNEAANAIDDVLREVCGEERGHPRQPRAAQAAQQVGAMSTASGLMLLMTEHIRIEHEKARMHASLVGAALAGWYAIYWWQHRLTMAAEATRYQLTYTPGP